MLHDLLPTTTSHEHFLRPRAHNFVLPDKDDRNSVNRMLFKDIYWVAYVTLQASYLKFLAYINTISRATYIDIYMEENLIFQDFECIYTFLGSG